jgi:glycosyltransferase 2 family protein
MRSKALQIIQYLILLATGLFLAWLFFRNLDFAQLKRDLRSGDLSWFILVMLVSVTVYIIRVLRWQMLIKASGYRAGFLNTFSALSIGYFVNFAVPRLGEITRCFSLKKSDKIPLLELFGTVIVERVVDISSLIVMLVLTFLLQFSEISAFVQENIFQPFYHAIIQKIIEGNTFILFSSLAVLLIVFFIFYFFRKYIRERSPAFAIKLVKGLKVGLSSVLKLEKKGLFLFYTALIWVCYFLMTYFWFFVFEETSFLGWGACLSIVTIGTIGRSVPIQGGGMGAYHFLVAHLAILYGVSETFGKTLATLIHAGQTFFTFAMGLIGLIIFFVFYWRQKRDN